jgi:membrane-bound inhibitor of C-type lysozyme
MKNLSPLFIVLSLALAGCCTSHGSSKSRAGSETVLITYYPMPGKEAELEAALAHAWQVYQSEHLVYDQPHVVLKEAEAGGGARYVETFTWIKSPDSPSAAVGAVWKQEQALCEARDGHTGIEGGPVQVVLEK